MEQIFMFVAIGFGLVLLILFILNLVTNRELITEVVFDASKEKVWDVLTETDKYQEWNPFIISITGEMKEGSIITNVMANQERETTFTPMITSYRENELLEWLGSGLRGTFKGNHYFKLSETEDGKTKMLHGENFSGILSGLIMQIIGKDTQANFVLMNEAMKKRVEGKLR